MDIPTIRMQLRASLLACPEGGFTAFCPQIKGAITEGETETEALENLVEAIEGILSLNAEIAAEAFSDAGRAADGSNRLKEYDLSVA